MRTAWNLKLLYNSSKDPKIEEDLKHIEENAADFEKKYASDERYLVDSAVLLGALDAFEKLISDLGGARPLMYFHYRRSLNSNDEEAHREINKITNRLHQAFNRVVFFEIALGKLREEQKDELLKQPILKKYQYYLEHIFKQSKHHLSPAEEKIVTLKSQPSYSMWIDAVDKILNAKTVSWKKKNMPLAEAENRVNDLQTKDRRPFEDKILEIYKEAAVFAHSELVAIATNKKIDDALRGFEKPYSATVLNYHNEEPSVEALVKAVTDNFSISHEFYKLKKKLLKVPYLLYADRAAPIGRISQTFSFSEGAKILRESFGRAHPEFKEILDRYLELGQIDVYPKKGKDGGAYMSGAINQPSFVMLNHVDTFDSLMTFAHEMGHAIHTEFSKRQPPIYQDYALSAAETASTLFENFAFDYVFDMLTPKEKIIALHNKINGDISTIFRQIACFNFEYELHNEIRAKGMLSAKEIALLMNKHMKAYLGPSFKLRELDGYFYSRWSHLRRFFYVYTYAYGELISRSMYARYKADPAYLSKIIKFLEAGGSRSPDDVFASIGIDTKDTSLWLSGLASITEDIKKLRELTD